MSICLIFIKKGATLQMYFQLAMQAIIAECKNS